MTPDPQTTEQEQWVLVITGDWNIVVDPAVCRLALSNSVPEDEPDADLHDFLGNASHVYEVSAMPGLVEALPRLRSYIENGEGSDPGGLRLITALQLIDNLLSAVHPAEGDKG